MALRDLAFINAMLITWIAWRVSADFPIGVPLVASRKTQHPASIVSAKYTQTHGVSAACCVSHLARLELYCSVRVQLDRYLRGARCEFHRETLELYCARRVQLDLSGTRRVFHRATLELYCRVRVVQTRQEVMDRGLSASVATRSSVVDSEPAERKHTRSLRWHRPNRAPASSTNNPHTQGPEKIPDSNHFNLLFKYPGPAKLRSALIQRADANDG
ncbi:hypothetical protein C8R47DRAFT_317089 [Mycena vitilis]|nr:hypothetical protein C8R47DRAFT_317089 [Mycena vitilis]